jgi:hypothetical protein
MSGIGNVPRLFRLNSSLTRRTGDWLFSTETIYHGDADDAIATADYLRRYAKFMLHRRGRNSFVRELCIVATRTSMLTRPKTFATHSFALRYRYLHELNVSLSYTILSYFKFRLFLSLQLQLLMLMHKNQL